MIAVGSIYPLRISVDQHLLTVISSDAYDVEEIVVESFIVNPGERFDFLLTANQTIGNYWIRADSLEVSSETYSSTSDKIESYLRLRTLRLCEGESE